MSQVSSTPAGADPYAIPIETIDVSDSGLFESDTHWPYFERLRTEDPVHYCPDSEYGPYWSVTRYEDIVYVEKNPEIFSSASNVVLGDRDEVVPEGAGFITMDGPEHDAHRRVVQPIAAPANLRYLEPLVRERAVEILNNLPVGETFDWVDRVSIELTTALLAIIFDFPYEQRRKLTYWSDVLTSSESVGATGYSSEERMAAGQECLEVFTKLRTERAQDKPTGRLDFVTALANAEATQGFNPLQYLGTIGLLIVGGNDTTRNSISGGILALHENPGEFEKLRDRPDLLPNTVSEIIRWQTPISYMRRTATCDTELRGKKIQKGDRVVMWYVSANRDEAIFDGANEFRIDRENARQHLAFGIGIHFCMGSRLAELQLRVLLEEILRRFRKIELQREPVRTRSNFIRGYKELQVRVHPL